MYWCSWEGPTSHSKHEQDEISQFQKSQGFADESFERGECIDEMMYAIDRRVYAVEVKMYNVRIAQIQAPTSDVVERDIGRYSESGDMLGHRSE